MGTNKRVSAVSKKATFMLGGVMAFSMAAGLSFDAQSLKVSAAQSLREQYGLKEDVQDGVILHAWDWSFDNIKDNMKAIADAGYSAVQTSPVQPYKQASDAGNETNDTWWLFYQPTDFKVSSSKKDNLLGGEQEFRAMCEEADRYGIKVIVDVVANHVAGNRTGGSGYDESIADYLKNEQFYHNNEFPEIDYGNRISIIENSMGSAPGTLPDLNTENEELQAYILDFLKACIDDGADGFRFDAAKHIGVPADGEQYTFFPNVVNAAKEYYVEKADTTADRLYCYGEILDQPGGNTKASDYTSYVNVTDNSTSASIRNGVLGGSGKNAALTTYYKNVQAKNVVLWAESHDEFQNAGGATTKVSASDINKTWAIVASRADASSLFYARTDGYHVGNIGEIGTFYWMDKEVAAVNDFHNYFAGSSEYLSYSDALVMNERGSQGAVIVNTAGKESDVSLSVHAMADGTYVDQVSENEFVVKDGEIKGHIGDTGIAVIYNAGEKINPGVTISNQGGTFYDDFIDVEIGLTNAVKGLYSVNGAKAQEFTKETVIRLGEDMPFDSDITLTLTAVSDEKNVSFDYKFRKAAWIDNVAYLEPQSGWSTEHLYAYIYSSSAGEYSGWPGEELGFDEETGLYKLVLPKGFLNAGVIFSDGNDHQYPLYNEGFLEFPENGEYILDKAGVWHKYGQVKEKEYAVYFRNNKGWNDVFAYMWADNGDNNSQWPGEQMELVDGNEHLYKINVNMDNGYSHVIFNNNEGTQTSNLDLPGYQALFTMGQDGGWQSFEGNVEGQRVVYFRNSTGWDEVYVYTWNGAGAGSNSGWPGEPMAVYDADNGIYYYVLDNDIDFDKIIFNNNSGTQTSDLDIPSETSIYIIGAADKWEEYTYVKKDTGKIVEEWGNKYCVDEKEEKLTGLQTIGGETYYFGDDGLLKVGLQFVDEMPYFFDEDGKAVRNQFVTPYYDSYYFDADGTAHVGWLTLDGDSYYFDEHGAMLKGMQTIDGKTYLFDRNNGGKMVKDKMAADYWGDHYYDAEGVMQTGFVTYEGNTYYFFENGDMAHGWQTIDEKTYFFKEDGTMATGTTFVYWRDYEFDENGVLTE
ncbi:starch-binding protein [Butyrivibrio sp. YAB3001]|uniref:starch-binding protein n=1 Tax=Butyrivibrio sp. YAB3001 TaxID=1520812 RepID=UPI0008F66824|nr:starch-binding protein [Butyrivibrio sp. YAB3001]SFC90053.1 glucan-binding repeat-containing protein [Butyrivibrio sp. YAB3001]